MKMSSEQSLLIQYSEAIKICENLRLALANPLNPCSIESKLSVEVIRNRQQKTKSNNPQILSNRYQVHRIIRFEKDF